MAKLIAMQGLQGSGKSTWAREYMASHQNTYRVNGDEVRSMAYVGKWDKDKAKATAEMQYAMCFALLNDSHNVILDNMNLSTSAISQCKTLSVSTGAELIWQRMEATLDQCIARDRDGRRSLIGRAVIENTARRYGLIPWDNYRQIVIVDIDGTLTDVEWRTHHVTGPKKDWATFLSLCAQDKLREPVAKWVRALAEEYDIVLVSGRNEKYYEHEARTDIQLESIPYKLIFMRSNEDHRKDYEVKLDILKGIPHDKIAFAIDDRPSVVEKVWRASGIKVYPVGALSQPEYW